MKIAKQIMALVAFTIVATPLIAAEDDIKALGQFQGILEGINQHRFTNVKSSIDKRELTACVSRGRVIDPQVLQILDENFWTLIEAVFTGGMPNADNDSVGELVQFTFQGGAGLAVVRYALPKYKYAYQAFELRHDSRGRLKIVDWLDYGLGQTFCQRLGDEMITIMPSKAATRKLLAAENPSDLQLFQVTEILKASRDKQPERFFEIYDDLDEHLRREEPIAKFAVVMAVTIKDDERFQTTMDIFVDIFSNDIDYALKLSDYFLATRKYEDAYASLQKFDGHFDVKEGTTPARLSALALALGKADDAEKYAVEATNDEPTLELGWWSLLRARVAANNFQGALVALTSLEDNFDLRLDEAKLRRDKFRGFTKLVESQEFKDWRAGR